MSTTRVRPCRLVPASGVNASPQRTLPVWQRSQVQALLPGRRGTARARGTARERCHDGFFPEGADYTGPPAIPSPETDQGSRIPPSELHYDGTAYLVSPTVGIFSMATLEQGARTRAGVRVGDDLELVRDRYDRTECGEAVAGEPLLGGETPTYPWCRAIVTGTRIFFGEDPIESITLTRYGTAK